MKLTREEALKLIEVLYDVKAPEQRRRLAFATLRGMIRILIPADAEIEQEED